MVSPQRLRVDRDGLTPASQSAEGWSDPGISEWRVMVSPQYLRVERDGLTPASQSGEGWSHPGISERSEMVSPRHLRAESNFGYQHIKRKYFLCVIFIYNCCT